MSAARRHLHSSLLDLARGGKGTRGRVPVIWGEVACHALDDMLVNTSEVLGAQCYCKLAGCMVLRCLAAEVGLPSL
jgi:hypothetical protein